MNSAKLLHNNGNYEHSDEKYTPIYAVEPLVKHIKLFQQTMGRVITVWCPFDTTDSAFVRVISAIDRVKVVYSHNHHDNDFFNWKPNHFDLIISNPPFKGTRKVFERAMSFNKPFALLSNLARFSDKYPIWLFEEQHKQPQLLKFDNRIIFIDGTTNEIATKIPFQTGYICWGFLERDFTLASIPTVAEAKKTHEYRINIGK